MAAEDNMWFGPLLETRVRVATWNLWGRYGPWELRFPAILMGDLNADPETDEVRMLTGRAAVPVPGVVFRDAWVAAGHRDAGYTWSNDNPFARDSLDVERRIDFVLVGPPKLHGAGHVVDTRIAGDAPVAGMHGSDHLAMVAELRY